VELHRRVEQISALVAELRQAAGDGPKTRELLDSIFRNVHTFKAVAAAESRTHASSVAHEFENLLHDLRTGIRKLDGDVLRVFEDATAALLSESDSFAPRLRTVTTEASSSTDQLPAEFSSLKDEERHRALSALREGSNLYAMAVVFAVSDFDERYRKLKAELEKIAELISSSAAMQDDEIIFKVVYAAKSEKISIQTVVHQAILAGKATAAAVGKEIQFVAKGDELVFEKARAEALADALLHLVRNAVDHGIERQGTVVIEVSENEVSVTDDGRGISASDLPLIFQPGFSTASEVTELSGRGVGLDVVKSAVEELGGSVEVASEPGKGSSFKIRFPNQY
jgi:two-component system, chemotaxis family, sensor kinase CheA